jgi:hypothetical protein
MDSLGVVIDFVDSDSSVPASSSESAFLEETEIDAYYELTVIVHLVY